MSQAGILDVLNSNPDIPTTFDTDSGSAVPIANTLEILGDNGVTTSGSGNTVTVGGVNATAGATAGTASVGVASFDSSIFTVTSGFVTFDGPTTDLHTARYIVSPGGSSDGANYTTFQSAITAASSAGGNQTVFIQPGTYIEDPTFEPNINVCAYVSDSYNDVVKIVGKVSYSGSGNCSVSGISFETNSDYCFEVTGANSGELFFNNCRFNGSDNDAINFNASNLSARFADCFFTSSSNALFTVTDTNGIDIQNSEIKTATGTSTIAAGRLNFFQSKVQDFTATSSGSGLITAQNSWFFNGGINSTIFTCGGSGVHNISNCFFNSGSATALVINNNAELANVTVRTTNATAAISGSGTLTESGISFTNSGNLITTSTQTPRLFLSNVQRVVHPSAYPYTVLKSDQVIMVDTSSTGKTINLPASPETGLTFRIKDDTGSAATNNITISPASGNIDGSSSATINIDYGSVDVTYGGSEWHLL